MVMALANYPWARSSTEKYILSHFKFFCLRLYIESIENKILYFTTILKNFSKNLISGKSKSVFIFYLHND